MLSLAAAAWAPLRTVSQKVSPGAACVIIATVIRGVEALPAEMSFPASSAFLPPELLEHPATSRAAAAAAATTGVILRERGWDKRSIFTTPHCATGDGRGPSPGPAWPATGSPSPEPWSGAGRSPGA